MERVIFTFDNKSKEWKAEVEGIDGTMTARQCYAAVVLTCQQLDPTKLHYATVKANDRGTYDVTRAALR